MVVTMRDAQLPLEMVGDYPNLLKLAYGQHLEVDPAEVMRLHAEAEREFGKAAKMAARNAGSSEDWRTYAEGGFLNPGFAAALMSKAAGGPLGASAMFFAELRQKLQEIGQSINKDITLTSPIPTGLVPFDLVAPARLLYPTYSPLRNRIPRTSGMGTSRKFKAITAIEGSRDDFFGDSLFINEIPAGAFNQLNLPPAGTVEGEDRDVAYAFMGVGDNASLLAEMAGRGFQDVDALVSKILLQRAMLKEERTMLCARRTSQLASPSGVTCTAQAPSTGFSPLTGVTTNVYVKVTAISGLGETAGSAAASAAPSGAQDVKVAWSHVPGAIAYRVYISTGGADPGDGSRYFAGQTVTNSLEIGGALPTSGATVPTTNTTRQSNGYDGIIAQIAASGGYVDNLDAPYTTGAPELQKVFNELWNATKASPDELWVSGGDRNRLSTAIIAANNGQGAARIMFTRDESGRIIGGDVVTSIWNQTTGKEVPLTVHPWLSDGLALFLSYQLPFPGTETPNVWENVMVQDYLGLTFPLIDIVRRFAIIWYGALVCYAPLFNGALFSVTPS